MKIGLLQVELKIPGAMNLKDKRRVVRSIKDRLHREHLVSVAEVGALETWNLAIIAIAIVSADGAYAQSVLDAITRKLQSHPEAIVESFMADVVDVDQLRAGVEDEDGSALWTEAERREAEELVAADNESDADESGDDEGDDESGDDEGDDLEEDDAEAVGADSDDDSEDEQ